MGFSHSSSIYCVFTNLIGNKNLTYDKYATTPVGFSFLSSIQISHFYKTHSSSIYCVFTKCAIWRFSAFISMLIWWVLIQALTCCVPSTTRTGKVRTYQEYVPLPHVFPPSAYGRALRAGTHSARARKSTSPHYATRCVGAKKSQRTRNFVLSSGAWHSLRSSPLLLQFRLRRSECLSSIQISRFENK